MPTINVMLSDVASSSPRPRSSCGDSLIGFSKSADMQLLAFELLAQHSRTRKQSGGKHSKKAFAAPENSRATEVTSCFHDPTRNRRQNWSWNHWCDGCGSD